MTPAYYVVSRELPEGAAEHVARALGFTPACCAIVSRWADAGLAAKLAPFTLKAESDDDAESCAGKIAEEENQPCIVIGLAPFLDAVYADGRREPVSCLC
jgi:hypothetical protein